MSVYQIRTAGEITYPNRSSPLARVVPDGREMYGEQKCSRVKDTGEYLRTVWDLFDDGSNCDSDMPLHFALAELAYSMR